MSVSTVVLSVAISIALGSIVAVSAWTIDDLLIERRDTQTVFSIALSYRDHMTSSRCTLPTTALALSSVRSTLTSAGQSHPTVDEESRWRMTFDGGSNRQAGRYRIQGGWVIEHRHVRHLRAACPGRGPYARIFRRCFRFEGLPLMQAIGGILLVALMFGVVILGTQWLRTQEDLNTSRRTVEGYVTLIEGLYAFRADNVSQWPASFTNMATYLPLLQIDSVDPMQAGANGDGGRYTLAIVGGNLTLTTTVHTESHAQAVVREFGSNGSYATVVGGFEITVAVPDPGGIALMRQTLLTDGTNRMHRPLWIQNVVSAGGSCSGTGMAVNASGSLMKCDGGTWQTH